MPSPAGEQKSAQMVRAVMHSTAAAAMTLTPGSRTRCASSANESEESTDQAALDVGLVMTSAVASTWQAEGREGDRLRDLPSGRVNA